MHVLIADTYSNILGDSSLIALTFTLQGGLNTGTGWI